MSTRIVLDAAALKQMHDVMDLATVEFAKIHELLDTVEVPRTVNDEPQSASQRVAYFIAATRTYGNLIKKAALDGHGPH